MPYDNALGVALFIKQDLDRKYLHSVQQWQRDDHVCDLNAS